jgi:hypothetical protein
MADARRPDVYNAEWADAFRDNDSSNPSHIFHDGDALCGVSDDNMTPPTHLAPVIREVLLHPATDSTAPDSYCDTCLQTFHARYEFALDAADLECPECGATRRACVHPTRGVVACKACNWVRTDDGGGDADA